MCEAPGCTMCVCVSVRLRAAGSGCLRVRVRSVSSWNAGPHPDWGRLRSPRRGGVCGGAEPGAGRSGAEESRRFWRGSWSPGAAARPECMEGPPPPAPLGAGTRRTA